MSFFGQNKNDNSDDDDDHVPDIVNAFLFVTSSNPLKICRVDTMNQPCFTEKETKKQRNLELG